MLGLLLLLSHNASAAQNNLGAFCQDCVGDVMEDSLTVLEVASTFLLQSLISLRRCSCTAAHPADPLLKYALTLSPLLLNAPSFQRHFIPCP